MTYPAVPLPNQWTNTYVSADDTYNRIDIPINAIANAISIWGQGMPKFSAIGAVNPGSLNTNINFGTFVHDCVDCWNGSGTGWDAANKRYVVQLDGLYAVQAGWVQASAVAGQLKIITFPAPNAGTVLSGQMGGAAQWGEQLDATVNLTSGTQISLQMANALATAATVANQTLTYLSVMMIGY